MDASDDYVVVRFYSIEDQTAEITIVLRPTLNYIQPNVITFSHAVAHHTNYRENSRQL